MLPSNLIQCLRLLLILTVNERVHSWIPSIRYGSVVSGGNRNAAVSSMSTMMIPINLQSDRPQFQRGMTAIGSLQMTASEQDSKPTTFREAEVLGLRLMQEGKFDAALKGKEMKMNCKSE
jgi:hypothetical protein